MLIVDVLRFQDAGAVGPVDGTLLLVDEIGGPIHQDWPSLDLPDQNR